MSENRGESLGFLALHKAPYIVYGTEMYTICIKYAKNVEKYRKKVKYFRQKSLENAVLF